jgi:hypothetical protein
MNLTRQRTRLFHPITWLLACLSVVLLTAFGPFVQNSKLVVMVRDIAGAPLEGISVRLFQGLTTEIVPDSVRTGPDGLARFEVRQGTYLIAFGEDWGPKRFIPLEEQNAGVNAESGGGFPVNLSDKSTEYFFTFVVVPNADGNLVPLIDLSRDPGMLPEPYLYDGPVAEAAVNQDLIDIVTLQPMATAPQPGVSEAVSEDGTVTAQPDGIDIVVLVIGVVVAGGAVVFMWTIIFLQSRDRNGGSRNASRR